MPRTGKYRFQAIGATPGKPGQHALFVDGTRSTLVQYAADLALRTSAAATTDLRGNGRSVAKLAAPRGGVWRSTARVRLVQGINELELSSAAGILLKQVTTTRAAAAESAAVTIEAENTIRHGTTVVNTATQRPPGTPTSATPMPGTASSNGPSRWS